MAVYIPPATWSKAQEICSIIKSDNKDGFTCYIIRVHISPYTWKVSRRYKEFAEVHEKMVKQFSVDKALLPPKKVFGNKNEVFINDRLKSLEFYIQTLLYRFKFLPEPMAKFLDFHKYEVRAITTILSERFFYSGEKLISENLVHEFSTLELNAITKRLKLGEPTCYSNDPRQDVAHLIEFISQLKKLRIQGSSNAFETSDLVLNNLSYDLSVFKSLDYLEIWNCKLIDNTITIDSIRAKLKNLVVHKSLDDLRNIFLCGILHWCSVSTPFENWPVWENLVYGNFSHNSLTEIHVSIKLLSKIEHLDLSHNNIRSIENLETLCNLSVLNLSHNNIDDLDSLHTKLGNIFSLNLSSNRISCLDGFSRMFSISELILKNNLISSMLELENFSRMPCLEKLNLFNNPVTLTLDYRSKLLVLLGNCASEIILDERKPTEKEMDTVSVLQALKLARNEALLSNKHEEKEQDVKVPICISNCTSSNEHLQGGTNPGKMLACKISNASKFRQQIETLRKVGGSDWLHILNERKQTFFKDSPAQEPNDAVTTAEYAQDKRVACHIVSTVAYSSEISFPDWFTNTQCVFDQNLFIKEEKTAASNFAYCTPVKIIWMAFFEHENTDCDVPVCILIFEDKFVILKLDSLPKTIISKHMTFYPNCSLLKCILLCDILSVYLGPLQSYVVIVIKSNGKTEHILLKTSIESFENFTCICENLYNIHLICLSNPFFNQTIQFESIDFSKMFNEFDVQKKIMFGKRVNVSKLFHNCASSVMHYAIITPSHLLLIEEKLRSSKNVHFIPKFSICLLVNVQSNVKQIHLSDIENPMDLIVTDSGETSIDKNVDNYTDFFHKCGSWLQLEFDNKLIFHVNFFNAYYRSLFFDAFLTSRNQL